MNWLDGMRGRVAATLLLVLIVQFVGGEIIFKKIETAWMRQAHAERLGERLAIAEELIVRHGDNVMDGLNRVWGSRLVLSTAAANSLPLPPHDKDGSGAARSAIFAGQPTLSPETLSLRRRGEWLEGSLRLRNGNWISFRSEHQGKGNPLILHYLASGLLLLGCVAITALLFGRMIGRPLRQIVDAAETAGRDEPVAVSVDGPREVRQVATAFERLQTRLLSHLHERVQSLAAMSHDLRTPLARLRLNASTVPDGDTRSALERDVEEMEEFVSSILDYLRGDDAEQAQRVDIASIVMTIVNEERDTGADGRYSGPDRLEAITRPMKLKRVLRNVVQNAIRHAGNAEVHLEQQGPDIIISVNDNGLGIPENDLEAVLEPFVRLEPSRNRTTGGAGLGLTIAKRLVMQLGGSLSLRNRSQGGLTVTLRFPVKIDVG